jgi:hypothetical protein
MNNRGVFNMQPLPAPTFQVPLRHPPWIGGRRPIGAVRGISSMTESYALVDRTRSSLFKIGPNAAQLPIVFLRSSQNQSLLFFAGFLAIPLARQSSLDAALLAGLEVVGVPLDFLDDVLLLNLALKPAQRILERLAFLNANLGQNPHLQTCLQKAPTIILESRVAA